VIHCIRPKLFQYWKEFIFYRRECAYPQTWQCRT